MGHFPIQTADPRAGYLAMRPEIDAAIRSVLEGPGYILGDAVARFEEEFAAYIGVSHGIGVNNGTDALHLAMRAVGIGAGDEVITVSHTAVATVAAIAMAGATPVLADVDPRTRTIDPALVEELITPATKAVIAVHLYGHPAHLEDLVAICDRHGLVLIEDCAQSHGAEWNCRRTGSFGRVAAFSFYPTKNLGAIGDAGMVLTNDPEVASQLRLIRQYGWDRPQYSLVPGWNTRLDPVQAAILSVKLKHLDAHTARRRALAVNYVAQLADLPLTMPTQRDDAKHVYHLFVVEARDKHTRDGLREHLMEHGINAGIHYPFGVHQQPAYAGKLRTGSMGMTEQLARTVLSLPLYPELSDTDHGVVCRTVRSFFEAER